MSSSVESICLEGKRMVVGASVSGSKALSCRFVVSLPFPKLLILFDSCLKQYFQVQGQGIWFWTTPIFLGNVGSKTNA